jgi:hypothetical protein
MLVTVFVAVFLAPSSASAQLTEEEQAYLKEKKDGPSKIYLMQAHINTVHLPDFLLDQWLARHSSTWEDGANLGYGLDFVLRKPDAYDVVFSAGFVDLSMPDDWWAGSNKDPSDADWVEFPVSIIQLSVSMRFVWVISEVFEIYTGGGIGVFFFLDDIYKTDPSPDCIEDLYLNGNKDFDDLDKPRCKENGRPGLSSVPSDREKEDDVPPLLPSLDLVVGTQFTFAKHYTWRIEAGGLFPYLRAGMGFGYQWW